MESLIRAGKLGLIVGYVYLRGNCFPLDETLDRVATAENA
jgi:hypothetical protein